MSTVSLPATARPRVISQTKRKSAKLTLWPLVAATFFMVSGGTYGTEDIVHGAGYAKGILILVLTPLLWSLPTAYMIGELSSAIPAEGGYYAWVRRAMGNFWGFQEAWLSLVASIFDMAIYPTLFVAYLTRVVPWFSVGNRGLMVGLAIVTVCAVMNIAGIRVVAISSLWLFFLLSAPFALIVILAPFKFGALGGAASAGSSTTLGVDFIGGMLIAMWNYMGWDNASTIATEVDKPKQIYPRAMILCVVLVSLTYIVPIAAMWLTGAPASAWETGSWADLGGARRRAGTARGAGAGRDDERVWDVQRAGDELFAVAAGDGAGWDAAADFREEERAHAGAVGGHRGLRDWLGALPGIGLRAAGDD